MLASTRSCEVFAGGEHCTSLSAGELLNGPENVWLEDERVSTPPSEEPEVEPTAAPPTP